MTAFNPRNERIKRRYFHCLLNAEGLAEATINNARLALADYERFSEWGDFKNLTERDAIRYRESLLSGSSKRATQLSSRATVNTKLMHVEKFFRWLSGQEGFRKAIVKDAYECFGLSRRDKKLALQRRPKPTPSLEEVRRAVLTMPESTIIDRRNKALMALLLLTGSRISSLASLKLKHVHRNGRGITHDALEVRVKGAKSFPTFFFPVGEDIETVFGNYLSVLRNELAWGDEDPLFPSTKQTVGAAHMFETTGLKRAHWQTADPVRRICRKAFDAAGLPNYPPHSIRRTIIGLGQMRCRTPQDFKAWSQNIGHEDVMTSFRSYGVVSELRQAELLSELRADETDSPSNHERRIAKLIADELRNAKPPSDDDGAES